MILRKGIAVQVSTCRNAFDLLKYRIEVFSLYLFLGFNFMYKPAMLFCIGLCSLPCFAKPIDVDFAYQAAPVVAISKAKPHQVVRNLEQLQTSMKQGGTPLDALSTFGQRQFLRSLIWGSKGLGGFSTQTLIRELNAQEIKSLMQFFDTEAYAAMLIAEIKDFPVLRLPDPSPELEQRVISFDAWSQAQLNAEREKDEHAAATRLVFTEIIKRFQYDFAHEYLAEALNQTSTSNLVLLFDVASGLASQTQDAAIVQHMHNAFAALKRRNIDTRRGINRSMLDSLSNQRQFEQAREFIVHHPDLNDIKIPVLHDELGKNFQCRSVLAYNEHTNTLQRQSIEFTKGKQLIMVVDGGCHFSRDALTALSPQFASLQIKNKTQLMILTPPATSVPLHMISQWNAKHKDFPIRAAFNRQEWQDIDFPSVPRFYIYENGQLKKTIVGWLPASTPSELLQALE
jgi:hypothetical protein